MEDFTLPRQGATPNWNRATFEAASRSWAEANDHTFVNAEDYSNLFWTAGIDNPAEIVNTTKISTPATNDRGLQILNMANRWGSSEGFNIRVNGMARPQAVQDYMRQFPRMMGVAAKSSSHRQGAIDFDYIRNNDGTINRTKTDEFINYLKQVYKVLEHANHIHVTPS